MAYDSYAVAAAIAVRFSAANVTQPTGYEDIKVSTAELPEAINVFPTVLVGHPSMSDATYAGGKRSFPLTYPVTLYLARHDGSPRRAHLLHDWVTATYGQMAGQLQLGLSTYVAWAEVASWRAGVVPYMGEEYDGIRYDVMVHINEVHTGVAA